MQHITKLCADYLRAFSENYVVKLKASHAHELVAAFFGYKSRAAMLADTQCPLSNLPLANIIMQPDMDFIEQRRNNLQDLPVELPNTDKLSKAVFDCLSSEKYITGEIWSYQDLEFRAVLLGHDYQRQPELKKYFPATLSDEKKVEITDEGILVTFTPLHNRYTRSLKKPYLKTSTFVWFKRIAGRIGYAMPEVFTEKVDMFFLLYGQDKLYEKIRTRKAPKDMQAIEYWDKKFRENSNYLDKNFPTELSNDLLGRLWELTLCDYLRKSDVELLVQSGKHSKPDFKFKLDGKIFYLEGVAVSPGDVESLKDPLEKSIGKAKSVPRAEYKERFCAAFKEKAIEKYQGKKGKGYKKVVGVSDGFVLAMSMGKIPFHNLPGDFNLDLSCLFGISDRKIDINTGVIKYDFEPSFLKKSTNSLIDGGYFMTDAYSHVSAVILSYNPFVNYPEYEDFLIWPTCKNDFVLIHNPFAKIKLPRKHFPVNEEYEAVIENNQIKIIKVR